MALDGALRGVRLQLRDDRGRARHARGHLPLRGGRPAPRRAGRPVSVPPRVAARSTCARGTASPSRSSTSTRAGRVVFNVGPRRTLTVSGGGPTIQAEIGPIDYPDSYASPSRFINSGRQAFRDPAAPGSADEARVVLLPLLVPALGRRGPAAGRLRDDRPHATARASGSARSRARRAPSPPSAPSAQARPHSWRRGTCETPSGTSTAPIPAL